MNLYTLRYTFFGIAGDYEICRIFVYIYYLRSYNVFIH